MGMSSSDPILEYSSPNIPRSDTGATPPAGRIVCVVLTLTAFAITLRVEWVNARAGFPLPTEERLRSSPASEAYWRQLNSTRDPSLLTLRVLTSTESSELRRFIAKEQAHNDLRNMVDGVCFLQSLLVPCLLLWNLVQVARRPAGKQVVVPWMCLGLMAVSEALMVYRGYFFRVD